MITVWDLAKWGYQMALPPDPNSVSEKYVKPALAVYGEACEGAALLCEVLPPADDTAEGDSEI